MVSFGLLGIDPLGWLGHLFGGVLGGVAGDVISAVAGAVANAVGKVVAGLGTLWVRIGTPNLTSTDGGSQASDPVAFIQAHLWWYMTALAVLGVLVGSARMAWQQRTEPGRDVLKGLAVYVAVSGAGVAAIALLVSAADDFSNWIISQSLNGTSFGANITVLLGLTGASAVTGNVLGPILIIVLGLLALLASLIQIFLMVVRGGMLVILAGILPTAAAAAIGGLESGRQWLKKSAAWLVAFALYKPAAAIVYAVAFRLVGSDVFGTGGVVGVVTGLALMLLALLALPALMRFVTPLVAAVASGGAGGVLGAGVAAAVTMPTGAMRLARGNTGAGASPQSPGPSGANETPGPGRPRPGGANGSGGADGSGGPGAAGQPGPTPGPTTGATAGAVDAAGVSAAPAGNAAAGAAGASGAPGAAAAAGLAGSAGVLAAAVQAPRSTHGTPHPTGSDNARSGPRGADGDGQGPSGSAGI